MGSGFLKKKKQAKAFQQQLSQMQEQYSQQLESMEVTGTAGNGLVQVTLNGSNDMKRLTIKPDCVDPEDIEGLEMLIKAAYNDANNQLKEQANATSLANGLPDLSSFGF
ncbi:MAG: YbaB/EbfC family nucleoid-associated protein [Verrucomicrobia bacterium]|nr:YbaB/EbfC family nucleoid-associated protein [Verrucomicrobiota bacterium]